MKFEKFPFKLEKQFRLKNWDYSSSGFYFITICTHEHINYFGEIKNNKIELNQIGKIAFQNWIDIPNHFPNIILDEFIIMPNHIHGILIIKNNFSSKINKINPNIIVGTHYNAFLPNENINKNNINLPVKNSPNYVKIAQKSTQLIPMIIKTFKSSVTRFCNQNNIKFQWQPRFHDRIIRSEKEFYIKKIYIKNNPKNWEKDKENV